MGVAQIVGVSQRDGLRIGESSIGVLIQPCRGLNVVLVRIRSCTTGVSMSEGWVAQPLEQIIWRAVLLKDDHHVLERIRIGNALGLLSVAEERVHYADDCEEDE